MNQRQKWTAAQIIRRHYALKRSVTDAEVTAEIANVLRKRAKGNQDDKDSALDAALTCAGIIEELKFCPQAP